ncbi:DUF2207 domain-containing protein [Candidatus Margulisiibacteriota bacterium]
MSKRFGLLLFYLFLFLSVSAGAETERLLSFHSDIKIWPDSSMQVTETIKVISTGAKIKRGIFRDFPTRYKDRYGNKYKVGFEIISAERDGSPINYWKESRQNGWRIYMGNKNKYLAPGEYTFTLSYTTNRQLGFFEDYDELYWNVTGNGWDFEIDRASARIELPAPAAGKIINYAAYTGAAGEAGSNYYVSEDEEGRIYFATERLLSKNEGLTVAVSWPKGFVAEPTATEKNIELLKDNFSIIIGLAGLVILGLYYSIVWNRVGKDPQKGVIIPLFYPPKGFSPSAIRYLIKMGFDNKAFAAAVINLAVNGWLTIEDNNGEYTLKNVRKGGEIKTPEEKMMFFNLLAGRDSLILENSNHIVVSRSKIQLERKLESALHKKYFFSNIKYSAAGTILSLVILAATVFLGTARENLYTTGFMVVWLTFWSMGVFALLKQAGSAWKAKKWFQAIFMSLFCIPFLIGGIVGAGALSQALSFAVVVIFIIAAALNVVYFYLLKAPTVAGRRIMDQIEGFKMYLSVAEKDRLNMSDAPEKTSQLFEKYLPYALALDVENQWAEKFNDILSRAKEGYTPAWYHGRSWYHFGGAAGFANNLGSSFSHAISSSSTPPGSSSGSGGGGFSGGGGGGGGGGGF